MDDPCERNGTVRTKHITLKCEKTKKGYTLWQINSCTVKTDINWFCFLAADHTMNNKILCTSEQVKMIRVTSDRTTYGLFHNFGWYKLYHSDSHKIILYYESICYNIHKHNCTNTLPLCLTKIKQKRTMVYHHLILFNISLSIK